MGLHKLALIAAAFAGVAGAALAQAPATTGPAGPAPDYRSDAVWLCRPGKEQLCTTGLDATRIAGASIEKEGFTPAADPKVDCFYVYPTVSRDPTPFSDLTPGRRSSAW